MTSNKHYQFVNLGAGIPSVLTVIVPGAPTIALGGNSSGAPASRAGIADEIRLKCANGLWSLTVETSDGGEITVCGDRPVFGDPA